MNFRTGIVTYAIAFLLGDAFVQQLSVLPDFLQLLSALICLSCICLLFYYFIFPRYCSAAACPLIKSYITLISVFILMILIGIYYSIFVSTQLLDDRLDESLVGRNIIISGQIASLPVTAGDAQRFEFDVDSFRILPTAESDSQPHATEIPGKLRLSWYYGEAVNAGETWQLEVRLKPPHGFMNPGGFDFEGWLFQRGIGATGYVRQSEVNQRLLSAPLFSIDRIRQFLSQQLDVLAAQRMLHGDAVSSDGFALVKALAIGDKSSISDQQWRVLRNTGTSHLMAISGLHIGLAALFGYLLMRRIVPVFVMKRIPAQHVALAAGLLLALLYALTAGLSIATQRAIIMLSVLSIMTLLRRNSRPVDSLGLAMILVLLIEPAAVLSAGFWFSFSAVAVIYLSLLSGNAASDSLLVRLKNILKQWFRLQLMISLFLLPLSLFMFQQASLVSPLANLLLIPYVSFLVVPLILLALLCSFLFHAAAAVLFSLAVTLLEFIWPVLSSLSAQPYASWVKGDVDIVDLLLVTTAMLLLYFSKGMSVFAARRLVNDDLANDGKFLCWSLRCLACLLFIPILITEEPLLSAGDYQLTMLDVGQGSAAIIRTASHVLVFDSGAKFSDSMDAGTSVLIPYLRSQGVRKLDRIIISHGDIDHIGGAQSLLDEFPEADLLGQDIEGLVLHDAGAENKQICYAGMQWQWDGVIFDIVSPEASAGNSRLPNHRTVKRNNHSCVLRISSASGSVLFTGDIEKTVEDQLLQKYPEQLAADILIVPHHGSNTSSSQAFISAVKPKLALISVGYKNRYRLPSALVTDRYEAAGSELLTTDKTGAVTVKLLAAEGITVTRYRETARKYWHHRWY
jgi:competence protein ComEC